MLSKINPLKKIFKENCIPQIKEARELAAGAEIELRKRTNPTAALEEQPFNKILKQERNTVQIAHIELKTNHKLIALNKQERWVGLR
jgi:hypothetical protein